MVTEDEVICFCDSVAENEFIDINLSDAVGLIGGIWLTALMALVCADWWVCRMDADNSSKVGVSLCCHPSAMIESCSVFVSMILFFMIVVLC
jgi:hypothetical protein